MSKLPPFATSPRPARPIMEPLAPPRRSPGSTRHKVGCTLDRERYVMLRTMSAELGLSGDDILVIALDRLARS